MKITNGNCWSGIRKTGGNVTSKSSAWREQLPPSFIKECERALTTKPIYGFVVLPKELLTKAPKVMLFLQATENHQYGGRIGTKMQLNWVSLHCTIHVIESDFIFLDCMLFYRIKHFMSLDRTSFSWIVHHSIGSYFMSLDPKHVLIEIIMDNFKFNFLSRGQLKSLNIDKLLLTPFKVLSCFMLWVFLPLLLECLWKSS